MSLKLDGKKLSLKIEERLKKDLNFGLRANFPIENQLNCLE